MTEIYQAILSYEFKRFLETLDEVSEALCNIDPAAEESHAEHINQTRNAHAITKNLIAILWPDYIIEGADKVLSVHPVKLLASPVSNYVIETTNIARSKLNIYISTIRALLAGTRASYLSTTVFPSLDLGDSQDRLSGLKSLILDILTYLDGTTKWLEVYASWLSHGAKLAQAFTQEEKEEEADKQEEEIEESQPEDFYTDVRVRAYAVLQVTDHNPINLISFLEELDNLLTHLNALVIYFHSSIVSMDRDAFMKTFNALTMRKPGHICKKYENHEALCDLAEALKSKLSSSLEYTDGFIYNILELLENTKDVYIGKIALDISEILAFIPTTEQQKKYIKSFESGRLFGKGC